MKTYMAKDGTIFDNKEEVVYYEAKQGLTGYRMGSKNWKGEPEKTNDIYNHTYLFFNYKKDMKEYIKAAKIVDEPTDGLNLEKIGLYFWDEENEDKWIFYEDWIKEQIKRKDELIKLLNS